VCELCEQLGYRWAVCSACGIEFPYQAADQLAALEAGRMDGEGGWPWFVECRNGSCPQWFGRDPRSQSDARAATLPDGGLSTTECTQGGMSVALGSPVHGRPVPRRRP
jgi:hypothetical protein